MNKQVGTDYSLKISDEALLKLADEFRELCKQLMTTKIKLTKPREPMSLAFKYNTNKSYDENFTYPKIEVKELNTL